MSAKSNRNHRNRSTAMDGRQGVTSLTEIAASAEDLRNSLLSKIQIWTPSDLGKISSSMMLTLFTTAWPSKAPYNPPKELLSLQDYMTGLYERIKRGDSDLDNIYRDFDADYFREC